LRANTRAEYQEAQYNDWGSSHGFTPFGCIIGIFALRRPIAPFGESKEELTFRRKNAAQSGHNLRPAWKSSGLTPGA